MNVYLICSEIGDEKLYKIGFTRRKIEDRIKEFETGNGSNIFIIDSYKSKWGTKIEAYLKRYHKIYNIRGEWFNFPDEEISNFVNMCELLHNNFELLYTNNTFIMDNG